MKGKPFYKLNTLFMTDWEKQCKNVYTSNAKVWMTNTLLVESYMPNEGIAIKLWQLNSSLI